MTTFFATILAFAEIIVGTWNLKWFPSGRSEHRAPVPIEMRTTETAAQTVKEGLKSRAAGDHVILFFEEMRSAEVSSNLVAKIDVPGLKLASASAFRNYDGRLGWQQNAIATDLPVIEASFSYWRRTRKVLPPRGYAYALLDAGADGLIACYGVHLKSNYGAKNPEQRQLNIQKRELAMNQLVAFTKKITAPDGRKVKRILIAGDFNTDPYSGDFKDEHTTEILTGAGYANCFAHASAAERATHVGSGRWPDSTLDFIFHRGFDAQTAQTLGPKTEVSDHRIVWIRLK